MNDDDGGDEDAVEPRARRLEVFFITKKIVNERKKLTEVRFLRHGRNPRS